MRYQAHPPQNHQAAEFTLQKRQFSGQDCQPARLGQLRLSRTLSMIAIAPRVASPVLTIGRRSTKYLGAAISAGADFRDSQSFVNFDRVQTWPRRETGNPN